MAFGVAAYALWGLFPLYWPLLKPSGATEILAHRIMWSLVAVLAMLALSRRWIRGLSWRRLGLLAAASAAITLNWGVYILAVNSGHTIDASLGYFINPLISVLFGVLIFRERLRRWQWAAVGLGAVAVVVLSVDYGRPPWIALVLSLAFAVYGLLKKFADMPSLESLAVETAVMFLPALGFALVLGVQGDGTFGHHGAAHMALLAGAGFVTAIPLLLFNGAATRLPLSVIGMLQYLTPVLQFMIGLFVHHEAMPASRWTGFVLVWTALAVLTWDGVRAVRRPAPVTERDHRTSPGFGPSLEEETPRH
ncbi:EamA family transporter RarD [Actinomadura viridis]|uniref:Chloramphenicol-sensitive protein RarD n=1 Tax=Actinomadura viridis TaxID=58110 RepID=A0A931GKE5_9ACTN|nr:EamA family transporter RarD [Actinomadura viridis]MBG6086301.1 chloramphenicol-sensitive protein RarD [Actinomadura viridis]